MRLLEAIEQTGSVSQLAKHVPLSYKAAWASVCAMNNLAHGVRAGAAFKASSVILAEID